MYCAIGEKNDQIPENDKTDAKRRNVTLIGATLPFGAKEVDLSCLDIYPAACYQELYELCSDVTHVIGHIPNLANGAINIRNMFEDFDNPPPQVVLVVHDLPIDDDGDVDQEELTNWLSEADTVISIGHGVYNEIEAELGNIDDPPCHFEYIPDCPASFLAIKSKEPVDNIPKGMQQILLFTGERKELVEQKIDFNLAIQSTLKAAAQLQLQTNISQSLKTQLVIVTVHPSDKDAWESEIKEIKERDVIKSPLQTKVQCIQDEGALKNILQRASLAIVPLKSSANILGLEALFAAYASVPVLASSNAGLAFILDEYHHLRSIVDDPPGNQERWAGSICQKILQPKEARKEANKIRLKILMNTTMALSHIKFIETITGKTMETLLIFR